MKTTRVVLADDHPMIRHGIRSLLEKEPDIAVIGEACDGAQALHMVEELNPDILLLDMEMPVLKGVQVARILQDAGSPVRILAFSAYNDRQYVLGTLEAGVAGYLTKDEAPEKLIKAVRGVARGRKDLLSEEVSRQVDLWNDSKETSMPELSERELDVLRLVVEGYKNHEIGERLGVSRKTVEKRLGSVFTKLGVSSRVGATRYAIKKGLF